MFWQFITFFGDLRFWIGTSLLSFFLSFIMSKKYKNYFSLFVFLILPSVIMSFMISHGLKLIFKTPRPCVGLPNCPNTYSLPSGHTSVIFAVMTALGLHYKKKNVLILMLIFAGLVGISRIVLGVHTIEDVLAGFVIGLTVGFLIQKAYETHYKELKEILS